MLQLLDQQEVAKTMVTEVMSAVTTGMTSAVSDISTGISGLIPVVIPVAAAIIAIGIGMGVTRIQRFRCYSIDGGAAVVCVVWVLYQGIVFLVPVAFPV